MLLDYLKPLSPVDFQCMSSRCWHDILTECLPRGIFGGDTDLCKQYISFSLFIFHQHLPSVAFVSESINTHSLLPFRRYSDVKSGRRFYDGRSWRGGRVIIRRSLQTVCNGEKGRENHLLNTVSQSTCQYVCNATFPCTSALVSPSE
ncbi:hypothetical protein MTR67_009861 [Solanum verrucosum]|uniref:Uncharacterized protein n=1 Tax=Solanum verrucosum TaxID=315347 RepID=A0AAF0TEU3_SOLVR|nr:hypothetical protein MTR67_009861 [Solanum verrucosum]